MNADTQSFDKSKILPENSLIVSQIIIEEPYEYLKDYLNKFVYRMYKNYNEDTNNILSQELPDSYIILCRIGWFVITRDPVVPNKNRVAIYTNGHLKTESSLWGAIEYYLDLFYQHLEEENRQNKEIEDCLRDEYDE